MSGEFYPTIYRGREHLSRRDFVLGIVYGGFYQGRLVRGRACIVTRTHSNFSNRALAAAAGGSGLWNTVCHAIASQRYGLIVKSVPLVNKKNIFFVWTVWPRRSVNDFNCAVYK